MSRQLPSEADRPWFRESHKKWQQRSYELGKQTINMLVAKGVIVTSVSGGF